MEAKRRDVTIRKKILREIADIEAFIANENGGKLRAIPSCPKSRDDDADQHRGVVQIFFRGVSACNEQHSLERDSWLAQYRRPPV